MTEKSGANSITSRQRRNCQYNSACGLVLKGGGCEPRRQPADQTSAWPQRERTSHCTHLPPCVSLKSRDSLCRTKFLPDWIEKKQKSTVTWTRPGSPDTSRSSWTAMAVGLSAATCRASPDIAP